MNKIKFLILLLASCNAFSLEYGECKGTQESRKLAVKELGVFAKQFIENHGSLVELALQYEQGRYNGVPEELVAYYIFIEPDVGRVYSWCQVKNEQPEKYSEIVESCSYQISSNGVTCKVLRYEFLPDKKQPEN